MQGLVVLFMLIASYRLLAFVYETAPVLMFSDRWMSLDPLFNGDSFWEGFSHKHGPHRTGLAYVLFSITTFLGDWNARWDMFMQVTIYMVTALLAWRLKYLIFKRSHWFDFLIPLIFITTQAALTVVINPYVHGLVPLFCLLFCLGYFIRGTVLREVYFSIVTFLGLFSGFALFASLVFLPVEGVSWLRKPTLSEGVKFILPFAGSIFIFGSQVGMGGTLSFENSFSYYLEYLTYLLGDFLVLNTSSYWYVYLIMGVAFFVLVLKVTSRSALAVISVHMLKILLILFGTTILFVAANVLGRADMGLENAGTSRYLPVIMPMMLGIYFLILQINAEKLRFVLVVGLALVMVRSQFINSGRIIATERVAATVKEWEQCLLESKDYEQCRLEVGLGMVPDGLEKSLQEKIDFLEANNLSIYKE